MPPANFSRNGGTFGSYIQISGPELQKVLGGANGPVVKGLMVVASDAKRRMIRKAPVYQQPSLGPQRKRKPGTLRDSHVTRIAKFGQTAAVLVGSDDKIALLVVKGTAAHPIVARRAPMLVFYWRKAGRVVRFRKVNHPGTRPNSYMHDSVREAIGALR